MGIDDPETIRWGGGRHPAEEGRGLEERRRYFLTKTEKAATARELKLVSPEYVHYGAARATEEIGLKKRSENGRQRTTSRRRRRERK